MNEKISIVALAGRLNIPETIILWKLDESIKKNEVVPFPQTVCKFNLNWINDPNIRAKTMKILEDIRLNLHGFGFGNGFLDMTSKYKQ